MRSFKPTLCLLLCAALLPDLALARYLGAVGPVYQIEEEDMLVTLARKLGEKEADGSIARLQEEMRLMADQRLASPPVIAGVVATIEPRSHYFDPTITLPQSIATPDGRLLAAAGSRVNPLDYRNWSSELLFLDGRDPRQQAYAARLLQQGDGRLKPVLVAGDFRPLSRGWRVPVFYDQGGELVQRFGITQVPAHVYQEGRRIRVDEVLPE